MLARHTLTVLAVDDLASAAALYAAAFSWPQTVEAPVYVEFALPDGQRLGLYQRDAFARVAGRAAARPGPDELTGAELYLTVPEVDPALAALLAAGATALSPPADRPWGDRVAYAADRDGHVIAVAQPLTPPEDPRAIARRWAALWNGADRAAFDALHWPDFVDRAAADRTADRDGLWAGIVGLRAGFPDFTLTEVEVLVEGERAAVRWSATGTHRGEFLGVAPTGRAIAFRGLELIRVVEGRVAERFGEWDEAGLHAQLAG
jgi:steroid delta-isomerase-like uncharacterized protein